MGSFWKSVLLFVLFESCAQSSPIVAKPGAIDTVQVAADNTLNSTLGGLGGLLDGGLLGDLTGGRDSSSPNPGKPSASASAASTAPSSSPTSTRNPRLDLAFVNNVPTGSINAYVTGLNSQNKLVLLQPDGSFYTPTTANNTGAPLRITQNLALPLGATRNSASYVLPDYISASRIYYSDGTLEFFTVEGMNNSINLVEPSAVNPSDPAANVSWGFVELTYTPEAGIFADISYVDFVGLPLGIELDVQNGTKQDAFGLPANGVELICNDLKNQTAVDGQPWEDLCVVDKDGKPLRVLAPINYMALNTSAFQNYWTPYVDEVYSYYTTNTLTINTQASPGLVNCTSDGTTLNCAGSNKQYQKPTAEDIFGCNSGPFTVGPTDNAAHRAIVPRLCAAFHRGTFLIPGGNVQPGVSDSQYYTSKINNWYSAYVHNHEVDNRGYAFAYDDVVPDGGADSAGVVKDVDPKLFRVFVGGPSSNSTTSTTASTQPTSSATTFSTATSRASSAAATTTTPPANSSSSAAATTTTPPANSSSSSPQPPPSTTTSPQAAAQTPSSSSNNVPSTQAAAAPSTATPASAPPPNTPSPSTSPQPVATPAPVPQPPPPSQPSEESVFVTITNTSFETITLDQQQQQQQSQPTAQPAPVPIAETQTVGDNEITTQTLRTTCTETILAGTTVITIGARATN